VLNAAANPGKLHGPFDTAEEFLASMHNEAKKLRVKKKYRITKAISESTKDLKIARYET
jgi:hypothetical protein